ncbi:ABC transporter permease [Streptomyces sp. NPDC050560]|uniref:ABC transporter permease n=1 Tax=Streptomyces sp. NPDC050560 TaxID=3365630 RepID=UPI0037A41176
MSAAGVKAAPGAGLAGARTLGGWARAHERALLGVLGVVLLLAAWQVTAALELINPFFISSPKDVAVEAGTYLSSPQAATDMKTSGLEFLLGFGGALVAGVPLGVALGWYRRFDALADPLVTFFYASPRIALTPLMVVWFGIGLESKAVIVGTMAIFPIMINMSTGVRGVDRQLIDVGRGFQASGLQTLLTIALPASLPSLAAGVRLGIGQALIGVFVAELVGASAGAGFTMNQAGQNFQLNLVFVTLFIIAGFGVVLTLLLRRVERFFTKWEV